MWLVYYLHSLLWYFGFCTSIIFVTLLIFRCIFRYRKRCQWNKRNDEYPAVAFFHPYCNAGGGGERVLWCAIHSLQKRHPSIKCVVYTGDYDANPVQILAKAKERFGISLKNNIEFVYLKGRCLVEARLYPVFTLLGQSLGGMALGFEALCSFVPDIMIETTGFPFVPPLFRYLAGCKTASYVHYPTISTDMLNMVGERRESYNNRRWISNNYFLSYLKLFYYKIFAWIYGLAGRSNDLIMVNSSWAYGHIVELWRKPQNTMIVYPPCDVVSLMKLTGNAETLLERNREVRILSVSQFRPEKDHKMQIKILARLLNKFGNDDLVEVCPNLKFRLVLAGGCRNQEDECRVDGLKAFADNLGVGQHIDWKINISFDDLKAQFAQALVGLHTMKNEHFGMCVVESMAAGLITVAHDSAGPKMDIINLDDKLLAKMAADEPCEISGFLADDIDKYVNMIWKITEMTDKQRRAIRENARKSCQRFSDHAFENAFLDVFQSLLT